MQEAHSFAVLAERYASLCERIGIAVHGQNSAAPAMLEDPPRMPSPTDRTIQVEPLPRGVEQFH